jgi:hypothetical protein
VVERLVASYLTFTLSKIDETKKIDGNANSPKCGAQHKLLQKNSLKVTETADTILESPTSKKKAERGKKIRNTKIKNETVVDTSKNWEKDVGEDDE